MANDDMLSGTGLAGATAAALVGIALVRAVAAPSTVLFWPLMAVVAGVSAWVYRRLAAA